MITYYPIGYQPVAYSGLTADLESAGVVLIGYEDVLTATDLAVPKPIFAMADSLLATDSINPSIVLKSLLSDTLTLGDALPMVARFLIADNVTLADETGASLIKIAEIAEILSVIDGQTPTIQIATLLMDLIAAREAFSFTQSASLEDTIALADQTSTAIRLLTESADFVSMTDSLRFGVTALISDQVSADDLIHPRLQILMGYEDTLVVFGDLILDGEAYTAWVMNTESTGMSHYTVPGLNSLFDHEGRVWGVSETGLWELAGDTDDGDQIDAWIKTGHMKLGDGREVNIPRAYLYTRTTGEMLIKTVSSVRGTRTERTYTVQPALAGDDDAARIVPLARGLRGVYWQVEIANVDGADFNIENCEVRPVVLSRRGQ